MLETNGNKGLSGLSEIVRAGTDAITEGAKAEQEQQKTLRAAITLVQQAGEFLGGVFRPASIELGHLFHDQMKFWRFRNAVSILKKAQTIADERGLSDDQIKRLGFGEGLRLFDAASLEEEESVQEMWARLMANSVDPSRDTRAEKVYVEILKSLSSREVTLLDLLNKLEKAHDAAESLRTEDDYIRIRKAIVPLAEGGWRKFSEDQRNVAIQNLVRLRVLAFRTAQLDLKNVFKKIPTNGGYRKADQAYVIADMEKFERALRKVEMSKWAATGEVSADTSTWDRANRILPEGRMIFTSLGAGLMRACAE